MSFKKTKLNRKKTKYENILKSTVNITVTDDPSRNICLCNGGLVNGVDQQAVYQIFHEFGEIENIVMLMQHSFSFIVYQNLDSSIKAYENLSDKLVWEHLKGPLFLCFVNSVPSSNAQNALSEFTARPPGLILLEDFVTPEEEQVLLNLVKFESSSSLKHRQVCHFGYEFKYDINNVDINEEIEPLPVETHFLWDRLSKTVGIEPTEEFNHDFKPDQLTINYYKPGHGIPSHVDTHSAFLDGILSLSLGSSIVMEFEKEDASRKVVLPQRSLCLMTGESRFLWQHGITPRKYDIVPANNSSLTLLKRADRVSFTFRKLRRKDCECLYHTQCDSYKKRSGQSLSEVDNYSDNIAQKLEASYVLDVYDKIADHFSETRHKPWPNVLNFVNSLTPGSLLVDVGCGNGKYFGGNGNCYELGCDTSKQLLEVCRSRGFETFCCNCLYIPVRDEVADGCISIAVIHHLATQIRRLQAIKEIIRVLRPGGKALIYVWAKNQERQSTKSSYLKQKKKNKQCVAEDLPVTNIKISSTEVELPVHTNRTDFKHKDLLVPWKLKPGNKPVENEETFLRYYHVFDEDELKEMCKAIDNIVIEDYYYDQGNWCVLFKKINMNS